MATGASASETKLSARLLALAEPLREQASSPERYSSLIALVALAWNIAILPRDERAPQLQSFMERTGMPYDPQFVALLSAIVERKDLEFPDDQRWVGQWAIDESQGAEGGWAITVAACDYTPGMQLG